MYKTEDPRATHLRKMSEQLGKDAGQPKWFEMSRAIELYINQDKKLNANVDFYSASTYATLGIDIDLYTPIFAVSRIAGWAAHVIRWKSGCKTSRRSSYRNSSASASRPSLRF